MALPVRTRVAQHAVVCTLDPSVAPAKMGDVGWIPVERAASLEDASGVAADVVLVRPCNLMQRASARDQATGTRQRAAAFCIEGVLAINEETDTVKIGTWLDELAGPLVVTLLGFYIEDITDGLDPSIRQRAAAGIASVSPGRPPSPAAAPPIEPRPSAVESDDVPPATPAPAGRDARIADLEAEIARLEASMGDG